MFFVARLVSPLGSLRNGMDTIGGICRIEHMFFGDPFWMKREVLLILFFCLDVFGVGWFVLQVSINSGSLCPRPSFRSVRANHALDSVTFHMFQWTDHGVFHASGENGHLVRFVEVVLRQVLWHCAVFSGWRAECVRGAG